MVVQTNHSIDGKATSKRKFHEICQSREKHHILIGDEAFGNHIFTDNGKYDEFLTKHPALAQSYLMFKSRKHLTNQLRQKIGERKANAFEARKNRLLSEINKTISNFLTTVNADTVDEETSLLQATVSPKLGSVAFFKRANYIDRFRIYEGLNHKAVCDLEADADTLSSIWMWGSIPVQLTLYELVGLNETEGATLTIIRGKFPDRLIWDPVWGTYIIRSTYYRVPDLRLYGFDNRTKSWMFWS